MYLSKYSTEWLFAVLPCPRGGRGTNYHPAIQLSANYSSHHSTPTLLHHPLPYSAIYYPLGSPTLNFNLSINLPGSINVTPCPPMLYHVFTYHSSLHSQRNNSQHSPCHPHSLLSTPHSSTVTSTLPCHLHSPLSPPFCQHHSPCFTSLSPLTLTPPVTPIPPVSLTLSHSALFCNCTGNYHSPKTLL